MKVLSGILRIFAIAIYIALIAALLVAAPLLAGYRPVVVLSPSMVPSYPVGSIIYYKAADAASLSVGDAITFKFGSSLATHRIIEKNEEERSFTTQGDNNPTPDQTPVPYDNVVGKTMDLVLPYAGFVAEYAQKHWYIVAILGVILFMDMMMPNSKNEKKEKQAGNKKAGKSKIDIRAMANIQRIEASPHNSTGTEDDWGKREPLQEQQPAPTKQQDKGARRDTPLAKMRPFPRQWR